MNQQREDMTFLWFYKTTESYRERAQLNMNKSGESLNKILN